MKNSVWFFFMTLLLLGLIPAMAVEGKEDAMIESIRFMKKDGSEIIEVRLSDRRIPNVFELDGENPRIVCDFMETAYPAGNSRVIAAGGELVKKIRIGLHHAPVVKTRVVMDLEENVQYSVDHIQDEGEVLVIRISPESDKQQSSEAAASPEKEADKGRKAPPLSPSSQPETEEDEQKAAEVLQQKEDEPDVPFSRKVDVREDAEAEDAPVEEEAAADNGMGFAALHDISFERSTNDKEMVLFRLSGFYPPVVFSAEENDLLVVCDFFDAVLAIGIDPVIETNGNYIKKVKVTTHRDPNKVRVILELADSDNYDLKQVFFKEDNLFVIIISSLGKK